MVLGLAAAAGMASQFSVAATMVSSISNTFTEIKQKVVDAFNEVKAWVDTNWPEPLTKSYWTNDEGTGVFDFDIDWDSLFSWVPEGIFTKEYWTNDEGTGAFDFDIDWDSLFYLTLPSTLTKTYWTNDEGTGVLDFDIDWDSLFSFTLPTILTKDYWSNGDGTGILDFDIDWNSLFSFTLPTILTKDYWSNDGGTGVLDFDIDWDGIFDFTLPDILTKDYWTNDEGTGVFDFELDWDDIIPEFPEWGDIIPSITEFFENIDWRAIVNTFGNIIIGVLNTMIGGMNVLFDSINYTKTIPNPIGDDWTVGVNLSSWNINEIPALAEGGIVTGPTLALIGEAGPEAVVPLDKGGGMGGTYNMTFNLSGLTDRSDKRQFAEEISRLIQQEMRRTVGSGTTRGRY